MVGKSKDFSQNQAGYALATSASVIFPLVARIEWIVAAAPNLGREFAGVNANHPGKSEGGKLSSPRMPIESGLVSLKQFSTFLDSHGGCPFVENF